MTQTVGSLTNLKILAKPYLIPTNIASTIPPRNTRQAPTEMLVPGKSKYALLVALVLNKTHANKTEATARRFPFTEVDVTLIEN
jgi:hypothetical protein